MNSRLKYHRPNLIYCIPNTKMIIELNNNFIFKYNHSDLINVCSFSLERYFVFKDISEIMTNAAAYKKSIWKKI